MAYRTLSDLINQFRIDNDDTEKPYKWTDSEVCRYFDQAQERLCEKINIIPDVINFPYVVDDTTIIRPEYITQVRSVFDTSNETIQVLIKNYTQWTEEQRGYSWEADEGTPVVLIEDMFKDLWRLYPIPQATGALRIAVFRKPTKSLSISPLLEITNLQQQEALILHARYKSYLKQDVDIFDKMQSASLKLEYMEAEAAIDKAVSRKQRSPAKVRYGGIDMEPGQYDTYKRNNRPRYL